MDLITAVRFLQVTIIFPLLVSIAGYIFPVNLQQVQLRVDIKGAIAVKAGLFSILQTCMIKVCNFLFQILRLG